MPKGLKEKDISFIKLRFILYGEIIFFLFPIKLYFDELRFIFKSLFFFVLSFLLSLLQSTPIFVSPFSVWGYSLNNG